MTACKISTDNSNLPWCTVATTDHPGRLCNHDMASREHPHNRKHQVAITARDHRWPSRHTCGGARKQTYSWCAVTNTWLTSSDRGGHRTSPQESACVRQACAVTNGQKDTLTYTESLTWQAQSGSTSWQKRKQSKAKEKRERGNSYQTLKRHNVFFQLCKGWSVQ